MADFNGVDMGPLDFTTVNGGLLSPEMEGTNTTPPNYPSVNGGNLSLEMEGTFTTPPDYTSINGGNVTPNWPGTLIPGPNGGVRYVMRAFKTLAPTGHVYWESFDQPDPTGQDSNFLQNYLTDIVVVSILSEVTGDHV